MTNNDKELWRERWLSCINELTSFHFQSLNGNFKRQFTDSNMKTFLTLIVTLFLGLNVYATAQQPDKIIYNGKEYDLQSNPLEEYFDRNPDKRPKSGAKLSSLWRGYVATFEVKDNQLFLKNIECFGCKSNGSSSVMNEVFPNQIEVKIDWLTGLLVIPHGKPVNYVHMGYASTFKNYILLEINKGDLKKEKHLKYKEYQKFKGRQFEAFKQTDEYKEIKAEFQKEDHSDEYIDSFLRKFVIQYSSKLLTE